MSTTIPFTAIIEREGEGSFALCPELDVASQGATVEEARSNLIEAIELLLESADREEIEASLREFAGRLVAPERVVASAVE